MNQQILIKCSRWKKRKPLNAFSADNTERAKKRRHGKQYKCKLCNREESSEPTRKAKARILAKKSAENAKLFNHEQYSRRIRNYQLKKKYGIDCDQYEKMLAAQHGKCPICRRRPGEIRILESGLIEKISLHVDHCHLTGKLRGLLCGKCNRAIGLLGDDIFAMQRAIEYLVSFLPPLSEEEFV